MFNAANAKKVAIRQLHIYPIKSCRGISLEKMQLNHLGPVYDRKWMIVDDGGNFLTQRQEPRLAQIETQLIGESLQIKIDRSLFKVSLEDPSPQSQMQSQIKSQEVQVWKSKLVADLEEQNINQALSEFLHRKVSLVRYGKKSHRQRKGFEVSFADGYPILLIHLQSLHELNKASGLQIPVDRFRANIVVEATPPITAFAAPFAEDAWPQLNHASGLVLQNKAPCVRCVITTLDQSNGQKKGAEPLQTLAKIHRNEKGVIFGINMLHSGPGELRLGDELLIGEVNGEVKGVGK